MSSWFKRGVEANREAMQREAERQKYQIRRWWLPAGTSGRLVWLDDVPFGILEHQLQIAGNWRNWFTCLENLGQACPLCDSGSDPAFSSYLTIGNLKEWTSNKNVTHRFGKELFGARQRVWALLEQQITKRNGIAGAIYEVTRGTKRDPASGNQFDFEEKVDVLATFGTKQYLGFLKDQSPAEYLKPFDYEKVLAPLSQAELSRVVRRIDRGSFGEGASPATPGGFPGDDSPWPPDDEVPF